MGAAVAFDAPVAVAPSASVVPFHEYSKLFPMLTGQPWRDLLEDVRTHGVREPIVLFEGQILDGRNRYMAAREVGAPYPTVEYTGPDPLAYSVSANLKRRHLTETQRAMAASAIATMEQGRRKSGTDAGLSQSAAAAMLSVSERAVRLARVVQTSGTSGLNEQVSSAEVSVRAGAEVARLPAELQDEIVGAGPAVVREVAAELRAVPSGPELTREQQAAVRVAAAEGVIARARPKPGHSHSNPSYCADPNFKAMSAVAGAAASIVQRIDAQGPAFIVRGFLDPEMRARNVAGFTAARDALTRLLEACNAH